MRECRRFVKSEDDFIFNNFQTMRSKEIAKSLNRTPASVIARQITLGVRVKNRTTTRFTIDEDDLILKSAGRISLGSLSKILNRPTSSIYGRAKTLGAVFNRAQRTARKKLLRNGYFQAPYSVNGSKRIWKLEHILVVEEAIGRNLNSGECVHHINLVRGDNALSNLFLFESMTQHRLAHQSLTKLIPELISKGIIVFNRNTGTYELCQ